MYLENCLIIVQEVWQDHKATLPFTAGGIPCYYLSECSLRRPTPSQRQARCVTTPGPDNFDRSEYEILRPGVQVPAKIPCADVGLVTPDDDEVFENTTFHQEAEEINGLVDLRELVRIESLRRGDLVWMDSSFAGLVPSTSCGEHVSASVLTILRSAGGNGFRYCGFMGGRIRPEEQLPGRICGSATWTNDGRVVSSSAI